MKQKIIYYFYSIICILLFVLRRRRSHVRGYDGGSSGLPRCTELGVGEPGIAGLLGED